MGSFSVRHAALTDRGQVRSRNEDAVRAEPGDLLFVVADGMGGHPAGDVASALAVEVVCERLAGLDPDAGAEEAREAMRSAVAEAGRRIVEEGRRDRERRGMGTTVTALVLRDGRWCVGHVGDSRGYLVRDGELDQVTVDHTVFPGSNTLTRALGTEDDPDPDVYQGELRDGDLFLLCSDGLNKVFGDEELAGRLAGHAAPAAGGSARTGDIAAAGPGDAADAGQDDREGAEGDLESAARELVEEANRRGAPDNVTVALVGAREG